jgi:hypothetical protein
MNIFAKFLAPKNKIFYELFEKSADNVNHMGALLLQVVRSLILTNARALSLKWKM